MAITEFFKSCCSHNSCEGFGRACFNTLIPSHWIKVDIERLLFSLAVKMPTFWGPKIDKKVINSSTKCLISVKIAILTPHIIPPPLVNIWLIFNLQKYVKWLCMFLEVNPCFQKAHIFCMDLQPAADPYNVVCTPLVQRVILENWASLLL